MQLADVRKEGKTNEKEVAIRDVKHSSNAIIQKHVKLVRTIRGKTGNRFMQNS